VKPRDAASLLLYRGNGENTALLVGRRPGKSRFMPDVYVFPGGGVEAADARAKPSTPLAMACAEHMAVGGSSARAQTMAMAAVRETFEETGLLIAQEGNPGSVQDPTWQSLAAQGLSADLSVLKYFARAITPATESIRFHARFFVCDVNDASGCDPNAVTQSDELLDLHWMPLTNPDNLPLRGVTQFILKDFATWLNTPDQWLGYAMYTRRSGNPTIQRSLPTS